MTELGKLRPRNLGDGAWKKKHEANKRRGKDNKEWSARELISEKEGKQGRWSEKKLSAKSSTSCIFPGLNILSQVQKGAYLHTIVIKFKKKRRD